MIVLAATNAQDGDIFNAIDANLPEAEFRMKLIVASGKPVQTPDRSAEQATFSNDRIKQLGYVPIRTPESTVEHLVKSF
ncbi:hypothetical protein OVA29_09930 [Exiguobacterium sp. SL14]|nr:hypothetical protein [Exiguobacterium sp. SL14]MCY1690943.1 hypothetical protein [Exiguobacterium sp. SL14]